MKRIYAVIAAALALTMLTACDGQDTTSQVPTETQAVTTQPPVTEAKDKEFTVEPNAIEGLKLVEQIYPLGSKFLMIGLNEYDGRAAVLYDPKTGEAAPKTLKRLSEAGDVLRIVQGADQMMYVFYALGETGSERWMETYDKNMELIAETDVEDMLDMEGTDGESVDFPTMQIDKQGNHYFLGWDKPGNHHVLIFDQEMKYIGKIRGDMELGKELMRTADGKVYLMYQVGAQQKRFAYVNLQNMTLDAVEGMDLPGYYTSIVTGTNGYDFYLNAPEAFYGVDASEGKAEVVLDWNSTMFMSSEVRGIYALEDGSFYISSNGTGNMDRGTWKMIEKK